jgi:hypothetical protein
MNYQRIYDTIIERGRQRSLLEYTEEHHIVPRCLGGTDDSNNLVELTAEEHYVCHQLLVKIYPRHIGLVSAAMFMTGGNNQRRVNNKTYGWLKRRFSEYMKGPNNPGKKQLSGRDHWKYGTTFDKSCWTEDGVKSMSESKLGNKNPNYGVKPWNHGRATDYTKSVWAKADEIYKLWKDNNDPAANRLYRLTTGQIYNRKTDKEVICPYMNMVKYFRNRWVPIEDKEWKKYKDRENIK